MNDTVMETLKFNSKPCYFTDDRLLNTSNVNGLRCSFFRETISKGLFKLKLKFDWDDENVEKLTGSVTIRYNTGDGMGWQGIEKPVNFEKPGLSVENDFHGTYIITRYIYSLALHHAPTNRVSYDTMFAPSMQHDAVLVIGEKKLHVNKAFLSYHSIYFRDLFVARNDEGNGIPIENVSFEDFGLLMSTIYPEAVQATYQTTRTLLELGTRFKIPAVMHHVENRLLLKSRFTNEQLILLADKYGLNRLMRKAIHDMNSLEMAGKVGRSAEYAQMSDSTRAKISDRLMSFIVTPK